MSNIIRAAGCQIFRKYSFQDVSMIPSAGESVTTGIKYILAGGSLVFFCSMEKTILFWKMSLHLRKLDLQAKLSYINNCFRQVARNF